ncbi:nucleotide sugar dehydrogenase [Candidatus Omnitrophota bacterium]
MNNISALKRLINAKKAKIAVIGLGYVGLPIAIEFVKKGFFVFGLDNDKKRVDTLKRELSYITDIKSKEIKRAIRSKKFHPVTDRSILKESDAIIVCVPTPLRKRKVPNMSYIIKATQTVKKYLRPGQLIVLESTTYPGTTRDVVLTMLESSGLREGKDFFLSFSPERIDPNNEKYTFATIPKVVGGVSKEALDLTKALYSKVIEQVVPVSSAEAAEVAKLLENTFRIVNIGLINEIAMLCNKLNIDVWEVVDAAKTKPFGFMPFYPGPGIGGHCLDGKEFVTIKNGHGVETISFESIIERISSDPSVRSKRLGDVDYFKPKPNCKMLTYDTNSKKTFFKPIDMLSKRKTTDRLYKIITTDDRQLKVTDRHPMFVIMNDEFVVKDAKDIKIGDPIPYVDIENHTTISDERDFIIREGFSTSPVKSIEKVKGDYVYSAEVQDTHTIITSYGTIVHNCIPADPMYLSWKARKVGFKTKMIDLASKTNLFMPHYVVERAKKMLSKKRKSLSKSKVLVLGVTYKKDVKDLRESPALDIITILQSKRAKVSYADPYIPYLNIGDIKLKRAKISKVTLKKYDIVILATDHAKFRYKMIANAAKLILDTRNIFAKKGIVSERIIKL